MARLDRLAPVRGAPAQIGAAIGREFSYRLLEAVSPIQGAALQDALGQLMAADLIHARGVPPDATYVFKHALVQDTAYCHVTAQPAPSAFMPTSRRGRWRSGSPIRSTLRRRSSRDITPKPALTSKRRVIGCSKAAELCALALGLRGSRSIRRRRFGFDPAATSGD